MERLIEDTKFALRMLAKRPVVWGLAGVILAFGIGATSTVFSLAWGVLVRPMPYKDPQRLVQVWKQSLEDDTLEVMPANFVDWQRENRVFSELIGYRGVGFNLTGGEEPQRVGGARVSADFFDVLGIQPSHGRTFRPEEGELGRSGVAVLNHAAWQRRFGGDPDIVGKTIWLDGNVHEVIGVLPADFVFLPLWRSEVYVPLVFEESELYDHWLYVVGRLADGTSLPVAEREMNALFDRLADRYPGVDESDSGVRLVSLRDEITGPIRPVVLVLLVAVGAVLLLGCSNVAVMLIALAATRQREIALRVSLGARRWRLVRQLLTESLLLAACGGLVGIAVAYGGIRLFQSLLPPNLANLVVTFFGIEMSPEVLAFIVLLSAFTAVAFGAWPALSASRPDITQLLKEGDSRSSKGAGIRGRGALLVVELALAVVLLISAGLLIRSFVSLQTLHPGFEAEQVLTAALELPEQSYPTPESRRTAMRALRNELANLPGSESVGAVSILPLELRNQSTGLKVRGDVEGQERPGASYLTAMPGYFKTLGIQLLRGEPFSSQHGADSGLVVIVSESLAERLWPEEDPLGKELILERLSPEPRRVIGVSEDVRYGRLGGAMPSVVYVPFEQDPRSDMIFVLRTTGAPQGLMAATRNRVWQVDDSLPVTLRPMKAVLDESAGQALFPVPPLAIFAGFALLLAISGIFGVTSFTVSQRRHEFGIRMAVGAQPGEVVRMVLMQGVKLTAAGLVIGLAGAVGIGRLLSSILYGVSATDPLVFLLSPLLLVAVTLVASYLPALRGARISPATVLRQN